MPKSTASKVTIFMAYSEVYLIILHLGGTSSFLGGVLRQRIPGSNMVQRQQENKLRNCRDQALEASPNNILRTQSHTKNNLGEEDEQRAPAPSLCVLLLPAAHLHQTLPPANSFSAENSPKQPQNNQGVKLPGLPSAPGAKDSAHLH